MRTLLLGSDFTYDIHGNLLPIEINTNVGWDINPVEDLEDIFNFTDLIAFINSNNFTKLTYIGSAITIAERLKKMCTSINIEFDFKQVSYTSITVPYVEDSDTHLIIRSSYDTTAIVDEEYCKNKVNFLNLIKNQAFGTEFAYMDDYGNLVNNITTIENNGNHPNFILKSVYPHYDHNTYPKLYKVSSMEELNVILSNVNSDYFLMKYHLNQTKTYFNIVTVIRSLNIIFPPNLQSIFIGKYRKIAERYLDDLSVFDINTFEINAEDKLKYISKDDVIDQPKLLDTDTVEMADGTFKTAIDLQVGDLVKTIKIPNPDQIDLYKNSRNYHMSYDEFMSGTTYVINTITEKWRVDKIANYVTIKFTDGTDWSDTESSSYLVLRNNEVIFLPLQSDRTVSVEVGDQIILVDTRYEQFTTVLKTVESIAIERTIFSGWEIVVVGEHMFLTKTDDQLQSFAAIEHNPNMCLLDCVQTCAKNYSCIFNGSECYCGPPI